MFGLDEQTTSSVSGNDDDQTSAIAPVVADEPVPENNQVALSTDNDLESLKKSALADLSPIVDQLDASAEQRFQVTMMMIQANEDSSLLGKAYEAAKAIDDKKARAQALYDLVSEINYFTSPKA